MKTRTLGEVLAGYDKIGSNVSIFVEGWEVGKKNERLKQRNGRKR